MKELNALQMDNIEGGSFWRCLGGTVGSGLLGVLAGAEFGPVGGILGGAGGLLVGAATFC
ncbi:MAG: Blp family class II bacteriocin [Bacteroidota bacterium]